MIRPLRPFLEYISIETKTLQPVPLSILIVLVLYSSTISPKLVSSVHPVRQPAITTVVLIILYIYYLAHQAYLPMISEPIALLHMVL